MDPEFDRNQLRLRLANDADVPALRVLVNLAYKELSAMGLNYTATYQDEATTRERMNKGRAFVVEYQSRIIATILYFAENHMTGLNTAYVGQFAVHPELKRHRIGSWLMDHCEALARSEGYSGIQLDTAKPALHLVNWYLKRGYKIVGETHWEDKTYDSYIFEKQF